MTPITEKSIAIDGKLFPERRRELRQRVLKGGKLAFNGGYGALECVVRNLSKRGARLAFGEALAVPGRFALKISGDERIRLAEVVWRNDSEIGVCLT